MLICDTSALLAYFDASDRANLAVSAAIDADPGPYIVSPLVLVELDYLLATRRGTQAELKALKELTGGAWDLISLDASDLSEASYQIERYQGQRIGLADASLAVLADRLRTTRVLTLDHRHFDVVRTRTGHRIEVTP
ncbi:MAG: PIN domain-containing protein [Candidatus Dormibacteria bacterium]